MIDADHWHDRGDGTAWWVVDENAADDITPAFVRTFDRPCDRCEGKGTRPTPPRWDQLEHLNAPDRTCDCHDSWDQCPCAEYGHSPNCGCCPGGTGLCGPLPCPECNGTGCHTFDVEVECPVRCSPADHLFQGGATCSVCNGSSMLTYRVSIEPGMVLPIVSDVDPAFIVREEFPLITIDMHDRALHIIGPDIDDISDVTLPPAASPGQYAVKVRITR